MDDHKKKGFKVFLKDKRKKSYPKILSEFIKLWIVKKELPLYYFKYLYRKDITNVMDYLSRKEAQGISHSTKLHNRELMAIISNKFIFSIFCRNNDLAVPELISYNFESNFYFDGNAFEVADLKDMVGFFETVFNKTGKDRLFLKPFSLYGGKGTCMIKKSSLLKDLEDNYDNILNKDYIHEDVLVQHEDINKIHASCVNTIRFETYIDNVGTPHILSAFMRFGIGKNVIDNLHSGGVFVPVDLEKGCLKKSGLEHIRFGGRNFESHPESKYPFENFKIPFFEEACQLVMDGVKYLPDRYIGWDIAISTDGPVIIEANEHMNIFTADVAYGGYLKHPLFREIIKEIA